PLMIEYFTKVRESLAPGGMFFVDHYGGYESMKECEEDRPLEGFTYVWDQHNYNPVTGEMQCYIHFKFPDGSKMKRAFEYTWRLWTLPEIQELMKEAGFKNVTVHAEGTDEDGEGDGDFNPADVIDADAAFLTYITGEK
ncbi:MAG: class I SAM-dependent methyltransferase, partial [Planctomycetota bacterium]